MENASNVGVLERFSSGGGLASALLRSGHDGLKLIGLDGRIIDVNPALLTLLQIDQPDELLGVDWESSWPEEGREAVRVSLASARGGQAARFSGFRPTKRGEPRYWEVSVSPVRDDRGDLSYLLACTRDVTQLGAEERELRETLQRQREALKALNADFRTNTQRLRDAESRVSHDDKLRAVGRFVGGVVHDFNNVFAAVHGAARLLKRRVSDETALEVVTHMEGAAERGAALARQLLDFARNEGSSAAEVFDPAELVARDAHLLRHVLSGRATLVLDAEPGRCAVLGQPQKLQSVLFNLVANARDAIDADGKVEVTVAPCPSLLRPQGLDAGDYVYLCVSDDGRGMSPETLQRAGEPFFTTKASGAGTGLGLASAFELAAECEGRAFIESQAGVGTRVAVYMRRSPVGGELVSTPDAPLDPSLHGGAKLLLVDDDPLVRDHLSGVFRELGYEVAEASSYEIAAQLGENDDDLDLVIADVNLKDGAGDDLVARLRRRAPSLPAILMSGSSGMRLRTQETALRKPVSEIRLAQLLLEKLGRVPAAAARKPLLEQVDRIAAKALDASLKEALVAWRQACETLQRPPIIFDDGPWRETLPPLAYVVAADEAPEPGFKFVRAGEQLSQRLGRELVGTRMAAGDEELLGSVARALSRRLNGQPGYDYSRFALGDGKVSYFERLILPLRDQDGRISHLFGIIAINETNSGGGRT